MSDERRTYVGELEWVIHQIYSAHNDRNPNRAAQIDGLCRYGVEVGIARRSKEPLPPRPNVKNFV